MKAKWIKINDLKLSYLAWGEKSNPPILLLHGFMAHAHVWDELAFFLSTNYFVIALDQRGHGDSEWYKLFSVRIGDHRQKGEGGVPDWGVRRRTRVTRWADRFSRRKCESTVGRPD